MTRPWKTRLAFLVLAVGASLLPAREGHAYIGESLDTLRAWCGERGGAFEFHATREGGYRDYRCTFDRGKQSLTATVAETTIVGFVFDKYGLSRENVIQLMRTDLRKMGKPFRDLQLAKKKGEVSRQVTWRHGDIETVGFYIYDPSTAVGRVTVMGSIQVVR